MPTLQRTFRKYSFNDRRDATRMMRESVRLSQHELARAADISQAKLSRFENGIQDLSEAAFVRVQKVLNQEIHAKPEEMKLAPMSELMRLTATTPQTPAGHIRILEEINSVLTQQLRNAEEMCSIQEELATLRLGQIKEMKAELRQLRKAAAHEGKRILKHNHV